MDKIFIVSFFVFLKYELFLMFSFYVRLTLFKFIKPPF